MSMPSQAVQQFSELRSKPTVIQQQKGLNGVKSDPVFPYSSQEHQNFVAARARNFNVTGFTLPVNMVYSADANVLMKAFGIAASGGEVQALVSRLVMQTESLQLSDFTISAILGQLTINITYEPLECKKVEKDRRPMSRVGCERRRCAMGGLVRSMDWSFAIHGPTTTRVERLQLVRAAAG
ncbi:hypothetical protein KIN20_022477, partial [Parelaphostrongylus tenuis]